MRIGFMIFVLQFSWFLGKGQNKINGTVTDVSNNPLVGANVYLEGTYDGSTTDENGRFSFETSETGTRKLVISNIAYQTYYYTEQITQMENLIIPMVERINQLTGVTLSAGTFEAGDNSKVTVLKPLDIVTTAGAVGDFLGALQTLPGTSTVNEDGRLFVRGGLSGETQVFIDGLRVFQPFLATGNNVPTRGRFSPLLFKGIRFSTGGYSAEYGQALSSVLLLNTTDVPVQEKTNISVMSVGGGVGHTKIWGDASLSLNTQYLNLAPYESLIPSNQGIRLNSPYESFSGEAIFRRKGEKSIFKLYTGVSLSDLDVEQEDINFEDFVHFSLRNTNLYVNTSYKHFFENNWTLKLGGSVSWDTNEVELLDDTIDSSERGIHTKLTVRKKFNSRFSLNIGSEVFKIDYNEIFRASNTFLPESKYSDLLWSGFAESDIFFSNDLALKLGGRLENTSVLNEFTVSPRVSLAYKSGQFSQFSTAYGMYYQNPLAEFLKFDLALEQERTSHYIFNYQYLKNAKTLRIEGYYKDYDALVKFDTDLPQLDSQFNNSGKGYATGIDIFWRDNTSFENLEYWISYSYLDTERDFRNFREYATPNFASRNNLSVVTKLWVEKLKSQIGASYNFASGRPYDNPNTPEFQRERTKTFNSLSLNWAYLIDQQKILYFAANNVLGFNNISNYQYTSSPNSDGFFERRAITPPADSFFFVGFFWTISTDKKSNLLDNL